VGSNSFESALVEARNKYALDQSGLLIVYYGGHGMIPEHDSRIIWYAWKKPPPGEGNRYRKSPAVDWTHLEDGNYLNVELLLSKIIGQMMKELFHLVRAIVWSRTFFDTADDMISVALPM
jgi:hypothetical protein